MTWRARETVDDRRVLSVLVLALTLAILAGAKLSLLPHAGPFGVDGSFYVNAARNVYEGVGLKTNVSMYHYGQSDLPTASRLIYPVWPLLVGYAGRVIGFTEAVNYLPPLFYILDLILLYLVTARLQSRMWGPTESWFNAGHLLVLLFGLNLQFFGTTTYPYTEGLGFFFAFLTLLLVDRAASDRPALFGALAGVAAGVGLLTRTQLVILGLTTLVAVVWVAVSDRRFVRGAIAYAAVYGAIGCYWYFFIFHVKESPRVGLPVWHMWTEPPTTAEWLLNRLRGVVVSLSPLDRHSYFGAFGPAFLAPIVASVVALVAWFRRRTFRIRLEAALPAAALLYGLGTYGSLNLFQLDPTFFAPWLFWYRHALPMIVAIAVGVAYLWGRGRVARWLTIVLGAASVILGLIAVVNLVTLPPRPAPTAAEAELGQWLDRHPSRPTIVAVKAQHLSVYTHANIHWTECKTPSTTTRVMMEKLPIDYLIVYASERPCAFVQGMGDLLFERAAFGQGADRIHVLGRRRTGAAAAPR